MTAIAAVLALSSTQLLAQNTDTPASADAPVLVTPPSVVQSTAPSATPQDAPQVAAPSTSMRTASTPIVNTPDTTTTSAPSAAAPARAVTHTKTTTNHTTSAAPRAADPAPVAPTPPVTTAKTIAKTTVVATAPMGGPETTTTSKTIVTPAAPPQSTQTMSDDGMIAGLAGLGVIALAGGAFAYTRRTKRYQRYEDIDVVPEPELELEAAAVIAAAPVAGTTGMTYAEGPRTEVPAGFDISRFGRHAQAAYGGPTPDNPSLSLKSRLKRASFYDQRERMAAAGLAEPTAPRRTEHADHIVSRMRPTKVSFRPVTA
jgi:hypothetical protein